MVIVVWSFNEDEWENHFTSNDTESDTDVKNSKNEDNFFLLCPFDSVV